jgi:hypothetical protein
MLVEVLMAFCTKCGATVNGAFCNQCGTQASAASGQAAGGPVTPPMMTPPMMQPSPVSPQVSQPGPVAMAPVARKTSPLVWVLVAVVGIFVLGAVAVLGAGFFIVHKARQAGLDPELMRRNPGLAVSKLVAAVNPDVEVVNTDEGAGTITVRDKKTGKMITMSFDQAKTGQFKFSATGDDGKTATMEFGAAAGKVPSWVPAYPGAKVEGTFAAKGSDGTDKGEGGIFAFTTQDSPSQVMSFYTDKCKDAEMKINMTTTTTEGGMVVAADEAGKHSLSIIVGSGSGGGTSVSVTYGVKD